MGAAAGGQLASSAAGAAAGGPATSGSSGEQSSGTGNKEFNFGNPNKGLYRAQSNLPMWAAIAAVAALLAYLAFKKK